MDFGDWGKGSKVATASHILLKERGEAEQLLGRIERGEISFEAAAQQFSTCGSAAKGGDLGSFRPGEMVPAFDAYCFDPATQIGAIGVIDTEFGTHLVRLAKQKVDAPPPVKKRRMLDSIDPETGMRS